MTNPVKVLGEAIADAARFHGKQTRKEGTPYIYHPLEVAKMVNDAGYPIKYQITAVLHDVLEDTKATPEDLAKYGQDVVDAVKLLSRNYCQGSEQDYIDAILQNKMALVVKNADRLCNLQDMARLGDSEFTKRYLQNTETYFVGKFTPALDDAFHQLLDGKPHYILDTAKMTPYAESELRYIAQLCIDRVNTTIAPRGFVLEYCNDYEFDNDDLAVFAASCQDDAHIFPVAANFESFIQNVPRDKWYNEMLLSMYHEAAHGLMDYISEEEDVNISEDQEEKMAEEYALYHCGYITASTLQNMLEDSLEEEI